MSRSRAGNPGRNDFPMSARSISNTSSTCSTRSATEAGSAVNTGPRADDGRRGSGGPGNTVSDAVKRGAGVPPALSRGQTHAKDRHHRRVRFPRAASRALAPRTRQGRRTRSVRQRRPPALPLPGRPAGPRRSPATSPTARTVGRRADRARHRRGVPPRRDRSAARPRRIPISATARSTLEEGTRAVLDAFRRALGSVPRVIFASSLAVLVAARCQRTRSGDDTALTPQSSYGTQKAIGEIRWSTTTLLQGVCRRPRAAAPDRRRGGPAGPNRSAASTLALVDDPRCRSRGRMRCARSRPETVMALSHSPRRVVKCLGSPRALEGAGQRRFRVQSRAAASRLFGLGRRGWPRRLKLRRRRHGGPRPARMAVSTRRSRRSSGAGPEARRPARGARGGSSASRPDTRDR